MADEKRRDNAEAGAEERDKQSASKRSSDNKIDYNKFILDETYPDATAVFTTAVQPLSSVAPTAAVVLDTNVLLVPYTVGPKSFQGIRGIYARLKAERRLVVPGQVAREFARLRGRKLAEVYDQLHNRRNKLSTQPSGKHPLLESVPEYAELLNKEEEMLRSVKEQSKLLAAVLHRVSAWRWDDPISLEYRQLFDSTVVVDPKIQRDAVETDLKRRTVHSIPPAYKDQSKDDGGIGDLLIWHTILQIGTERGTDVIFVSGEEKSDWWHRGAGQALFPRFELVAEFWARTSGKSFHLVTLAQLLEIYNAETATVDEVRARETVAAVDASTTATQKANPLIAALREDDRQVAILAKQGFSIAAIAARLGMSSGEAAMRLFDGQRTLEQLEAERAATAASISFPPRERWNIVRGCVEFSALANGIPLTCRVSEEALEDYFGANGVPTLLPTFNAARPAIEAIARRKILHKNLEEGDVSITTEDFKPKQPAG